MCENIDWNVGRILAKLKELNLEENTIVLYFCDNGPNEWRWNEGMKGRKGSTDEGGVRSPLIIRWTGNIDPGLRIDEIAGAIDLLPTLADLAGIKVPDTETAGWGEFEASSAEKEIRVERTAYYFVMEWQGKCPEPELQAGCPGETVQHGH